MLREWHQLDDEQSTTSADPTSPTLINRSQSETPSDSQYITPIRQTQVTPNKDLAWELDVDNPLLQPNKNQ